MPTKKSTRPTQKTKGLFCSGLFCISPPPGWSAAEQDQRKDPEGRAIVGKRIEASHPKVSHEIGHTQEGGNSGDHPTEQINGHMRQRDRREEIRDFENAGTENHRRREEKREARRGLMGQVREQTGDL